MTVSSQLQDQTFDSALQTLARRLSGELHFGRSVMRKLYATDASAYQELPIAVAIPETEEDVRQLILFADEHQVGLIPRTAGTSLAGQVVGAGIVVDLGKKMREIIELNTEERWVRVQPGVIRNELNMVLKPHGLLFGPETSTQNRAMIGGMMGNNSCGSNSVKFGSVRDHLLEVRGFLSDGSEVTFGPLTKDEFEAKCNGPAEALETRIYQHIREMLGDEKNRAEIRDKFPKPSIPRRNTGYALDLLMDAAPLDPESEQPFNFCKLIAGSEGTLFFATDIKLHINPLPPAVCGLQCAHFNTINEALRATLISIKYDCYAVELIDHFILECTKRNIEQSKNRFFVQGDPGAILVTELRGETEDDVTLRMVKLEQEMREAGLGYHFPVLFGEDTDRIWNLRKAGLGLLSNIPGDAKPVPVIEDTAVDVQDLPQYIDEFDNHLRRTYGLECVHYAHAGSGEIHLRPIIDLKTPEGNELFRKVAKDIAALVKKYNGSLSGEHGDGRLRGEFLKFMIGENNYRLVESVKRTWDPKGVFNPNKIVDTPPMNSNLRYVPGHMTPEYETIFDFSADHGILRTAELCNGSGDCRKTHLTGGTMCPSYMATRDEKDTTRARANILRQILTNPIDPRNPFDNKEIYEVMDLCLSCKGCKSECPSNVDVAKLKAEFLQHYYDANGIPLRARIIANFAFSSAIMSRAPWVWNAIFGTPALRRIVNKSIGFHPDRTIPLFPGFTLRQWWANREKPTGPWPNGKVHVFCDEFTNYNDVHEGIAVIEVLERLGFEVVLPEHGPSGRAALSKGLLRKARLAARRNVRDLKDVVTDDAPLVGIEPSALLTFRDEYPDLLRGKEQEDAKTLGGRAFLFEEFLYNQIEAGKISPEHFTTETRTIKLHGHCQQKAISSLTPAVRVLELPENYNVQIIPSGCCGMAGSFGYEQEHYDLSMKIGELVLFPAVRQAGEDVLIAAPGTSCRHQIHDGTGRKALHPAVILREALLPVTSS